MGGLSKAKSLGSSFNLLYFFFHKKTLKSLDIIRVNVDIPRLKEKLEQDSGFACYLSVYYIFLA